MDRIIAEVSIPSEFRLIESPYDLHDRVHIVAQQHIPHGTRFQRLSGQTISCSLLWIPLLHEQTLQAKNGAHDRILLNGVRSFNWVRLAKIHPYMSAEVNIIISKYDHEFVYETVKPISPGMEIVMCQCAPFWLPPVPPSMFSPVPLDLSIANKKSPATYSEFTPPTTPEYLYQPPFYNHQLQWMGHFLSSHNRKMIDCSSEISRVSKRAPPRRQVSSQSITPPTNSTSSQSDSRHADFIHSPFISNTPSPLSLDLSTSGQPPISNTASRKIFSSSSTSSPSPPTVKIVVNSPVEPKPKKSKLKTLPCSFCQKLFDRTSELVRHTRVHTKEKPYICSVCDKAFGTASSLNTHKGIHTGEKPHKCPTCGKGFTANSNLHYHKMTHIKDKPHKCSVCPKSFPTPGDLKAHMYKHTGKYPHNCTVCGKGFAKSSTYKIHAKKHCKSI